LVWWLYANGEVSDGGGYQALEPANRLRPARIRSSDLGGSKLRPRPNSVIGPVNGLTFIGQRPH
jgi:hypothetical protein